MIDIFRPYDIVSIVSIHYASSMALSSSAAAAPRPSSAAASLRRRKRSIFRMNSWSMLLLEDVHEPWQPLTGQRADAKGRVTRICE